MGAEGGRAAPPVTWAAVGERLREDPTPFEFFQAVRLLERLAPARAPVGRFVDPRDEVVRFAARSGLAFPASEVHALEGGADGEPPRLTVNFFGLTGPLGALPLVYSTLLVERLRDRDRALRDFLDLFNHRLLSLFYRAWEKHRFTIAYERTRRDPVTQHLLDLLGLGTPGLAGRLPLPDEALLHYAGLLAISSRPAVALEQLIADYFDVPAEVEQFVGAWYHIDERSQCRVGEDDDDSGRLGSGTVAGDEIWDRQSRIRLRLGPLARRQYDLFLPTGTGYAPLRALIRFFAGDEIDVEVQLILARDEVPACSLGEDEMRVPLGWCTWIRTGPLDRDPDETLLTL